MSGHLLQRRRRNAEISVPPECREMIRRGTLLAVNHSGGNPGIHQRWCTSDFKSGPIERELRRYLKAHPRFGGRLVSCLGIRRDESAARQEGPLAPKPLSPGPINA